MFYFKTVIYIFDYVSFCSERYISSKIKPDNHFSWSMAAILGGCMTYMDRNLPERNFRKSNPVMQGILIVITFGIYLLANVFRPANNMFSGVDNGRKNKNLRSSFTYSSLSVCVCCRCSKHSSGRMAGRERSRKQK